MPIYEYRCGDCGHEFETIQKISEAPLTQCPACEHQALQKKVSRAAFRLKGGGWYETDFKSGNKRNVIGAGDSSSSGSGSSGSEKSGGESSSGDKSATGKSAPEKSSGEKSSSEKSGGSTTKPAASSGGGPKSSGSGSA